MNRRIVVLGTLLVLAGIELLVRGPVRALQPGGAGDFAAPYAATRAWMHGTNPYDQAALATLLTDAGRETGPDGRQLFTMSVYPPPTFAALAPIAVMPWPAARFAWTVLLLAAMVAIVFGLAGLLRLEAQPTKETMIVIGIAVAALAPMHTAISRGQPGALAIGLTALALSAMVTGAPWRSGIALGVGIVLKPQVSAPFLLVALLRREWKTISASVLVVGIALVVGVGMLAVRDVPWMDAWLANIRRENAGGEMDPSGVVAFQMVDLRPLLAALHLPVLPVAASIGAALLALIVSLGRRGAARDPLLFMSALAVWTVLVGYHRFYDAVLIALPVAWALREIARRGEPRGGAAAVLVAASCFLIPGAWMLQLSVASGRIAPVIAESWWFRTVALPHQIWALLAIQVILLVTIARRRSEAVAAC
jgi:hypothetical protein